MQEEIEIHIKNIQNLSEREAIFDYIENILKTYLNAEGMTLVLQEDTGYHMLTPTDSYTLESLHNSIAGNIFSSEKTTIINNPLEEENYTQAIDNPENKKLSSLLLYPFTFDTTRGLFSVWKVTESEKEQVMMPLVVGGQVIGISTQSKTTVKAKSFDDRERAEIEALSPLFSVVVEKITACLSDEKEISIEHILEHISLKSQEETAKYFYREIVALKAPLNNLTFLSTQMRSLVHQDDTMYQKLEEADILIGQLNERLENISTAVGEGGLQEMLSDMKPVTTETYFHTFFKSIHSAICEKRLAFNFYLDPALPQEIELPRNAVSALVAQLLNLSIEDAESAKVFELIIQKSDADESIDIVIVYEKNNIDNNSLNEYYNLFNIPTKTILNNSKTDELLLSYKHFRSLGGKATVSYRKKNRFYYTLLIPYTPLKKVPLIPIATTLQCKIGILLKSGNDIESANNIARYLRKIGVEKQQIIGTKKFSTLPKESTHIIIFASQFSDILFEKELHTFKGKIMLVEERCNPKTVSFLEYESVDAAIEKDQFYMHDIYDFITHEGV